MFLSRSALSHLCHSITEGGDGELPQAHQWDKLKAFMKGVGFFLGNWGCQAEDKYQTAFFFFCSFTQRQSSSRGKTLPFLRSQGRLTFYYFLVKTRPTETCKSLLRCCVPLARVYLREELPRTSSGVHVGWGWYDEVLPHVNTGRDWLLPGNLRSQKFSSCI